MRPVYMRLAILAALSAASLVSAEIIYVDATSGSGGNTTLADGSTFTPPLNGTTGPDNNWEQRTVFGSSGNIYESAGEGAGQNEDAPELRTRITGLVPGGLYDVYVYFWDPTSTTEDWSIRAGTSSNPGANTLFSAADSTGELMSTAAVLASSQMFSTAPTINSEGGRALLAASLGLVVAAGGQIDVYIDDLANAGTVNRRTWYDGVGYVLVPEPAGLGLGATLAGMLLAFARARRWRS